MCINNNNNNSEYPTCSIKQVFESVQMSSVQYRVFVRSVTGLNIFNDLDTDLCGMKILEVIFVLFFVVFFLLNL